MWVVHTLNLSQTKVVDISMLSNVHVLSSLKSKLYKIHHLDLYKDFMEYED